MRKGSSSAQRLFLRLLLKAGVAVAVAGICLGISSWARADVQENVGVNILRCFHPTGSFIRLSFGQPHVDAGGRSVRKMFIVFRSGGSLSNSSYTMALDFDTKISSSGRETLVRMTPIWDNAPVEVSSTCSLTNWQTAY
jgi:hypothetical protein